LGSGKPLTRGYAYRLCVYVQEIWLDTAHHGGNVGLVVGVPVNIARPQNREFDDLERLSRQAVLRAGSFPLGRDHELDVQTQSNKRSLPGPVLRVAASMVDAKDLQLSKISSGR
jgi:hypothetical protein